MSASPFLSFSSCCASTTLTSLSAAAARAPLRQTDVYIRYARRRTNGSLGAMARQRQRERGERESATVLPLAELTLNATAAGPRPRARISYVGISIYVSCNVYIQRRVCPVDKAADCISYSYGENGYNVQRERCGVWSFFLDARGDDDGDAGRSRLPLRVRDVSSLR